MTSIRDKIVQLEVPGQGSISFNFQKYEPPSLSSPNATTSCGINLKGHGKEDVLKLTVSNSDIALSGPDAWRFNRIDLTKVATFNLLFFGEPARYLWVSLDKNRQCIKVGHGYMLNSNSLVRFEPRNESERENVRRLLEKIERVQLGDSWLLASPLKYWRLPVVVDPPPLIIADDAASLASLEDKKYITAEWLPMEAKRLYSTIKGAGVQLSEEQVKWLNHSINTPGCALYDTLERKEKRQNAAIDKKTGYIRIGMGNDVGDSVGDPFVLEIWPVGTESAIHSHGDAVAVIKVLHGAIEVAYYNPLSEKDNGDQKPIKTVILK